MKFEIKHRISGEVLFALECASLKICVEAAVKEKSDLSYSNLRGSNLRDSNLRDSNLRDSDLSGSDLSGSNLSYSDLSYSNLSYSNLRGSDLSYSNLRGSNLSYSSGDLFALGNPDRWYALTLVIAGKQLVRVGCREFSIAKARAYWAGKEDRREVLAALDYAEAIGKVRGWKQE